MFETPNSARRITVSLAVVVLLALVASGLALVSTWHTRNLLRSLVREDFPGVSAARGLENALLEQRGFASQYMLRGGSRESLESLDSHKGQFDLLLDQAYTTANSPAERDVLARVTATYADYDACRDEAIRLFRSGEHERASGLLCGRVQALAESTRVLCEVLVALNERSMLATLDTAGIGALQTTLLVVCLLVLLVAVCFTLLGFLSRGLLLPIRQMATDARALAGLNPAPSTGSGAGDLYAVGFCLRHLASELAASRDTVQRSQNQVIHSEKLATLGRLAASVVHEIRGPLTCIRLWLFSLQRTSGDNPEIVRKSEALAREVHRLDGLAENLLDFARPRKVTLRTENIEDLLDVSLELLDQRVREKHVRVVRHRGESLVTVAADSELLKQVLINVVTNATEAMPGGGEIAITTSFEAGNGGHPGVVVRIQDTGPGVAEDVRERLFEPFVTTKETGMGLGLSIAAELAALHGGRLVLESSTPHGSRFALHLPEARVTP
jgi:signal transduction histidine kinase